MSGVATHIAWRALQLLRALCFAIFLLSALLVLIVLSDFKSAIKTILVPAIVVAVVTFVVWYLLKGLSQEEHSRKPSTPAEDRSANRATLELEVRRLQLEILKKNAILSAVAAALVNWENARGRISAEQTLHDLSNALHKLADGFADSEESDP